MARAWFPVTCVALSISATAAADDEVVRDLYFGEALFYADQGRYFDALERLDTELAQHYGVDEPALDVLHLHVNDAEFSVGDFELNYRMHHRAGRAISAVLEGDVDEIVRNEAAYRLARIHFQKGQLSDALNALGRIDGRVPEGLGADIEFLRANALMASGSPADATAIFDDLQESDGLIGFAGYNMGIALLEDGQRQQALDQLDRAGQVRATDISVRSIRDKANLVLGTLLIEDEAFEDAQSRLDRVSLEGPMSNQALLQAGWAAAAATSFERAIVPWTILAGREETDAAVQEAKLALPYAYAELDVHGRAALLYGEALESFDGESDKLEASIDSIRKGDFLKVLVREEIRQDADWVIRLRQLPESPETYYLMELLASHDFQTALQNYLDLEDIRVRIDTWQRSFDAFDDMIEIRRAYYEPLLPQIDQSFRELDSRIRLRREQHRLLSQRLQDLLIAPRPEFLATNEERRTGRDIAAIEQALANASGPEADALRARVARLRGALMWQLQTDYHERLTEFDGNLRDLQAEIVEMTKQYDSFVRARQAAVHSFEGYTTPIRRLRTRVETAAVNIDRLMARQGYIIERVAVDELLARRERLNIYRDQARFALADSYDRATGVQETAFELGGDEVGGPDQAALVSEAR